VAGIAKSHSHAALTPVRTQPATRISPADEVKLLIAAVRESACVAFRKSIFQRTSALRRHNRKSVHRRRATPPLARLNLLLADIFALYLKTKNFHWHMSGPHFRDYHLLLDE